MKVLDADIIKSNLDTAKKNSSKRAIFCFHEKNDSLQRMVNTALSDTYLRPHKHENPDKLEIFVIIKGKVGVLTFDNAGKITESVILKEHGENYAVEIPPRTWHTFVVLSEDACLYEIIEGTYNKKTHKTHAPWAPDEDNKEEGKKYLSSLKKRLQKA